MIKSSIKNAAASDENFKFMPVLEINIVEEHSKSMTPQNPFANLNFSRRLTEEMKLNKRSSDTINNKHQSFKNLLIK